MRTPTPAALIAATVLALASVVAPAQADGEAESGAPAHPASIIDPDTPQREGMVLTASAEFNDGVNGALFTDRYLPHWSLSDGTRARYEVSDGTLKLRIDADQEPWDPDHDGSTRVSSLQTYQRDYLHRWTKYAGIAQKTTPFRGHLQKYGYFEVRAKVAAGGGLHSAWWMTGANQDLPDGDGSSSHQSGEVDIFEVLGRRGATQAQTAIHPWGDLGRLWPWTARITDGDVDLSKDFHTYGFEWTASGMKVYVDGELGFSTPLSPSYPMLTYLGVYEKREPKAWTGPFDPGVPYPKVFEVDYFRAYQFDKGDFPRAYTVGDGILQGQTRVSHGVTRWVGGAGNAATVNVYAARPGFYDLELGYRSGEPRGLTVAVNDSQTLHFDGLSSGSFVGKFDTLRFAAELEEGWNSIRLSNPRGVAPDLGVLRVLGQDTGGADAW